MLQQVIINMKVVLSTIYSNAWLLFLFQSIYSVPEELEDEADHNGPIYLFWLYGGTIDGSSRASANMDKDNSHGHWAVWWQEVFCETVVFL